MARVAKDDRSTLVAFKLRLSKVGGLLGITPWYFLVMIFLSAQARGEALQAAKDFSTLDQEVRAIKKEVLEINRELLQLEEELLYPKAEQLVIYISVPKDEPVVLSSIQIELNGREIVRHHYDRNQNRALGLGGVHRPYIGTLETGDHSIRVSVTSQGQDGRWVERSQEKAIAKVGRPKYLELRIARPSAGKDPQLEIFEW
ncbi:hypothetical protein DV711_10300 [Motiliproteus coralliicola]|uniref:AraC family transcriptional regulator n=1 Tax=Motiliproteus coralliicola TaxID=2283196 RepID=A0A369WTV7_9GAMM|nr:hypothetical protein [Motiliproteus coralliicola]RDE22935.1 hypothetical protein DV711_10300 [Motiliproteus coralliicola]